MYAIHPPFTFVFNEKDYQANIWFNKDLFGEKINFITNAMTALSYEVYPETYSFKIFDLIGNQIILNAKDHNMLVYLFKSVKLGIIVGDTNEIEKQDREKLIFKYASLV